MGDFEEKLNQILSNPQAMEQIMSLANSIAGPPGQGGQESQGADSPAPEQGPPSSAPMGALGGLGDLLSGLDAVLDERCGLPCHRPETPGMCTFKGMARILQDRKLSDLTVRAV